MWIFVGHFEFLNFDWGKWGFRFTISDLVLSGVPNFIQSKLLLRKKTIQIYSENHYFKLLKTIVTIYEYVL